MKRVTMLIASLLLTILSMQAQKQAEVRVDINKVENRIDPKLYGFLLEHIYHSVSNGIWGENVWNRSFEEQPAYGNWEVSHRGEVSLDALDTQEMQDFRICRGKDFELNLEVMRTEGSGPILIGVRDQERERMLTNRIYWYLGENGNTTHILEASTGWIWYTPVVHTATVDSCEGMLPQGKWMRIKIRCKGDSICGYIDSKQTFAQRIAGCPRDGAITLGGWDCRVAFRNIRVKPLDGTQIDVCLNPVRHWKLIGNGSVGITHTDALNDRSALLLRSTGRMAGIEQPSNFKVCRDDAMQGSVYLKGTVSKATVCLMNGEKTLAKQTITDITCHWKEFPLTLFSERDASHASLRIMTEEKGVLTIDQVSLMHRSSIENQGFRRELTDAAAELRPTILRWPGGSFSEQYRFENGIGSQVERKGILRWDDYDPLSFGTDEFITFCHKVGAEPQIVIPIGYHNYAGYAPDKNGQEDWLQRALDWMDYCNGDTTTVMGRRRTANGHPEPYNVKYWEIDNEVWKMDPKLYAELTRIFSIAMKKRYPGVKIIGCGCGRLGREGAGLDSIMIHDVAEYIDYISPHYYQTLDKYGNDGVEEYGCYLDKLAEWIVRSKNPDMKIYLSEWNLEGIDMRTGLFAGGFLNRLERTPTVEMAAPALFLRHTSAPGWNNAFINFNQNGWFPAPNYVVLRLWRNHFLPNRLHLEGDTHGLNIIATASDDRRQVCLKIVNPSDKDIMLRIKGIDGIGYPVWTVVKASSLTDKNTMEQRDAIKEERGKVSSDNGDYMLLVPPLSASVLSNMCFL